MTTVSRAAAVRVSRFRDLLQWTDGEHVYVLACDANAGIGQRPNDALDQTPEDTGYSAAKVPLMEVLAAGAVPFVLVNALGGPRDDYGRRILTGISAAIDEVDGAVELTGSDETNVSTSQTSVGVTVIGRAPVGMLRLGTGTVGDAVAVVGVPKDGVVVPYSEGDADIVNVRDTQALARTGLVHEVVPVGSRGIRYECGELARGAGGAASLNDDGVLDLEISAGASTCLLVALPADRVEHVRALVRPPLTVIGRIVAASHD